MEALPAQVIRTPRIATGWVHLPRVGDHVLVQLYFSTLHNCRFQMEMMRQDMAHLKQENMQLKEEFSEFMGHTSSVLSQLQVLCVAPPSWGVPSEHFGGYNLRHVAYFADPNPSASY